jgi:asparagine synthase (glutamine-hydrolysing)
MCGIAGYYSQRLRDTTDGLRLIEALAHRGPDDQGIELIHTAEAAHKSYLEKGSSPPSLANFIHDVCFAHTRYSIVDLSRRGHQPMWDYEKRACVVFNGEIYNYLELRNLLVEAGYRFLSNCDTEVIIAGYLEWGTEVFSRLNGPFAIVIYDRQRRGLVFGRDRVGKAPLYYTACGERFIWASEVKALFAVCDAASSPIREEAVHDFVVHQLRDVDGTFWDSVDDFPPGCYGWLQADLSLQIGRFWNPPPSRWKVGQLPVKDAIQQVRDIITSAVIRRTHADLPVGFELSGGMDSSAVVALAARHAPTPIHTFTVAFSEDDSNEEPFARTVAALYPTRIEYNVLRPPESSFWDAANDFVWSQEEPFHSPAMFTHVELLKMIKQRGFGVVISGAGGDELLAGYREYIYPYIRYLFRRGRFIDGYNEMSRNTEIDSVSQFVRPFLSGVLPKTARQFVRERLHDDYLSGAYRPPARVLRRHWPSNNFNARMVDNFTWAKMNYWLRSGDKINYSIPIEERVPLLDPDVVDYCLRLPPEYLIRKGWMKWILRMSMRDVLPEEVIWRRKKMGFPFPIQEWLRISKSVIGANLRKLDCPYINMANLTQHFDHLTASDPDRLWRLISVALWWKRVILRDQLVG